MAGVNNQYGQGYYMNPNYIYYYNLPWDQTHGTNPDYANSLPLNQTFNRGSNGIFLQPPNQVFSSPNPAPHGNNNMSTSENEPFYNLPYGYVENNEHQVNNQVPSTNYNSNNTIHSPFIYQTLAQTPSAPTYPNNAAADMVPNATSHGCVIIIMNANVNLERLLSVIQ